jgi:hypothetical protein
MKEEEILGARAVMFKDVVENLVCETSVFDCLKNKDSKSLCS